jgi:hypothetical protein
VRTIHTLTGATLLTIALVTGCGSGPPESSSGPPTTPSRVDLAAPPAAMKWDNYRGMRLPRSSVDGPKQVGEVASSSYSHTPQGAVLAAARGQVTALAEVPHLCSLKFPTRERCRL